MKLLWTAVVIAVGLSACTQKGSSNLEELCAKIEDALRTNQPEQIVDAYYLDSSAIFLSISALSSVALATTMGRGVSPAS